MPKGLNVVLAMGDDKTTLNCARGLAKQFNKNGKNSKIIPFSQDCLKDLSSGDVTEILLVGHAHDSTYGGSKFSPFQFSEVFDKAVTSANLSKQAIKRLHCFGCELGLTTTDAKDCFAQQIVDLLALQGYNLDVNAFSSYAVNQNKTEDDKVASMRVAINTDSGNVEAFGFRKAHAQRAKQLDPQIEAKRELIIKLDDEQSFLSFFTGESKELSQAKKDLKQLLNDYEKIKISIQAYTTEAIPAISNKEHKFRSEINLYKLANLREQLAQCEKNIQEIDELFKQQNATTDLDYQNQARISLEGKRAQLQIALEAHLQPIKQNLATIQTKIAQLQKDIVRCDYLIKAHSENINNAQPSDHSYELFLKIDTEALNHSQNRKAYLLKQLGDLQRVENTLTSIMSGTHPSWQINSGLQQANAQTSTGNQSLESNSQTQQSGSDYQILKSLGANPSRLPKCQQEANLEDEDGLDIAKTLAKANQPLPMAQTSSHDLEDTNTLNTLRP